MIMRHQQLLDDTIHVITVVTNSVLRPRSCAEVTPGVQTQVMSASVMRILSVGWALARITTGVS